MEANEDLAYALQNLSPEQRTAVVLHYIKGYKLREIASMLDVPLNTVKSRVMYARTHMKQEFLNINCERSGC